MSNETIIPQISPIAPAEKAHAMLRAAADTEIEKVRAWEAAELARTNNEAAELTAAYENYVAAYQKRIGELVQRQTAIREEAGGLVAWLDSAIDRLAQPEPTDSPAEVPVEPSGSAFVRPYATQGQVQS